MIRARSIACFAPCRRAIVVAGLGVASVLLLRGEPPARACSGWVEPEPAFTSFDPDVLGEPAYREVYYDRWASKWGGYTRSFGDDALISDWHLYLAGAVSDDDWRAVLFKASKRDLVAIRTRLADGAGPIPKDYAKSSLWTSPTASRAKLAGAVGLVALARDVEDAATWEDSWDHKTPRPALSPALLVAAKAGMTAAAGASPADRFLAQRYAFQAVRILFYQSAWPALIQLFDREAATVTGPAYGLGWRARYYLAGALSHTGNTARADLELAHVHASYPLLAGATAGDFHPEGSEDWSDALALARTPRDKVELWRLVGVRFDGVAAIREILKIDPRSNLIALLLVRELGRAETRMRDVVESGGPGVPVDPAARAAAQHGLDDIGQLVRKLQQQPGVDRPWLLSLIAGHLAARRGDLATARAQLGAAVAARPADPKVGAQVRSSLAIALVATWRFDAGHEHELGALMNQPKPQQQPGQPAEQIRLDSWREVREQLAQRYLRQGRLVDAELLHPGTVDPTEDTSGYGPKPTPAHWSQVAFIQQVLARVTGAHTEFERFVADEPELAAPRLLRELAIRHALDGDFAAAAAVYQGGAAESSRLEVDPFVTHIKDCRDCDEQTYAKSAWTHASVIAKLAALAKVAAGTGEDAAEASIQIGHALYNFTSFGNARRVLRATHQDTYDARPALRWYTRAYDLSKDRERKARAAYFAAKAERGNDFDRTYNADASGTADLPTPEVWFPKLKQLSNTRYYKEVLKECGTFQAWLLDHR